MLSLDILRFICTKQGSNYPVTECWNNRILINLDSKNVSSVDIEFLEEHNVHYNEEDDYFYAY